MKAWRGVLRMLVIALGWVEGHAILAAAEESDPAWVNARRLYAEEDWDAALQAYQILFEHHSQDPRIRLELARCYMKREQWIPALTELKQTVSMDPEFFEGQVELARMEFRIGEREAASARIKKLMVDQTRENDPRLPLTLAEFNVSRFQHDAAETNLARTLKLLGDEASAEMFVRIGKVFEATGRLKEARGEYEKALEKDEGSVEALLAIASLCVRMGQTGPAETYLDTLQQIQPDHRSVQTLAAEAQLLKDVGKGVAAFEALHEAFPDDVAIGRRTVELWVIINQLDKAFIVARRFSQDDRLSARRAGNLLLGKVYLKQGRYTDSLAAVAQVLARQEDDPEARLLTARVLFHQGKYSMAAPKLAGLYRLFPDNLELGMMLGRCYQQLQRADDAEAAYLDVARRTKAVEPQLALTSLYLRMGRKDDAIAACERVLVLDATNAFALNNLSHLLAGTDATAARALDLARTLVKTYPGEALFLDTLAWALIQNGQEEEAIVQLKEALVGLGPQPPADLYFHLGVAYHRQGKGDVARSYVERALELSPRFPGSEEARNLLESLEPETPAPDQP